MGRTIFTSRKNGFNNMRLSMQDLQDDVYIAKMHKDKRAADVIRRNLMFLKRKVHSCFQNSEHTEQFVQDMESLLMLSIRESASISDENGIILFAKGPDQRKHSWWDLVPKGLQHSYVANAFFAIKLAWEDCCETAKLTEPISEAYMKKKVPGILRREFCNIAKTIWNKEHPDIQLIVPEDDVFQLTQICALLLKI